MEDTKMEDESVWTDEKTAGGCEGGEMKQVTLAGWATDFMKVGMSKLEGFV